MPSFSQNERKMKKISFYLVSYLTIAIYVEAEKSIDRIHINNLMITVAVFVLLAVVVEVLLFHYKRILIFLT